VTSLRAGVSAGSETDDARVIRGVRQGNVSRREFGDSGRRRSSCSLDTLGCLGEHDAFDGHILVDQLKERAT